MATNVLQDGALSEIHFIFTFDTELPFIMSEGWRGSAARNLQADLLKEESRNEDVEEVKELDLSQMVRSNLTLTFVKALFSLRPFSSNKSAS